jgi:hypothetical protein
MQARRSGRRLKIAVAIGLSMAAAAAGGAWLGLSHRLLDHPAPSIIIVAPTGSEIV